MNKNTKIIATDEPPTRPSKKFKNNQPDLLGSTEHDLCPGCGEPIAIRLILEVIEELGYSDKTIASVGIGCYTAFTPTMDIDLVQALHGRAPSIVTGIKRMLTDRLVFTVQGDGDMVNEGLQEVIHTAARGEKVTCIMLNNGVFGETGGHMTATTVEGQRTKNSLDGRDSEYHGHPIDMCEMLAPLGGTSYVARGSVTNAADVARTKRYIKKAFKSQLADEGFSFIEILTMCPTGWFVPVKDGPDYLDEIMRPVYATGEIKLDGKRTTK